MKSKPIPLAVVAMAGLVLSQMTLGQEKGDASLAVQVVAVKTSETAGADRQPPGKSEQAPSQAPPRNPGKRPCRKPSGEVVSDQSAFDNDLSTFDNR